MLTEQFYIQLATLLKDGPSEWGPLSVAVGRGAAGWDRFPPALQRDITELQDEVARAPVAAEDIVFLDSVRNTTETPTEILRIAAHLTPGSVSGTLRECGLFSGEKAESVLLAYFVHPRLDLRPVDALDRCIQLDLRPGPSRVEERVTRYPDNSESEELHDLERDTAACHLGEIRVDGRQDPASIEEARVAPIVQDQPIAGGGGFAGFPGYPWNIIIIILVLLSLVLLFLLIRRAPTP